MEGSIPETVSRSVLLWADMSSMHLVPWASTAEHVIGQVLCDMRDPQSHHLLTNCCRSVAKNQLSHLDALGYTLHSGFEIEFSLTHSGSKVPVFASELGGSYMNQEVFTSQQGLFFTLDRQLRKAGVRVDTMHTELCGGQFEVTFEPCQGISAADHYFLASSAIRTLSSQRGMDAHFDAVLLEGETGNATHFNSSLLSKATGKGVFWDPQGEDNLCDEARHWIAGILKHMPALTALCAPTSGCFRRYHTPWNPHVANWDIDNRACTLRVKNWTPSLCYVENRLPSGMANPYLVLAGTVAAGIDGLVNKLTCPPQAQLEAALVPANLQDALDALKRDTTFVKALGEEFVAEYIKYAKGRNCVKDKQLDDKIGICKLN